MGHWVCFEYEPDAIQQLEQEGSIQGYCEILIEQEEERDAWDRRHVYYTLSSSTGEYSGRYEENPYSDLFDELKRDGYSGPYKVWYRDGDLARPPGIWREIWVRIAPLRRPF
jgi:hypothetical protein